jgi:pentatricopeptide repeat protein
MSEQDIQKYEKMLVEDPQSRAFAPLAEAYRKVGKLDDAIRVAEAGLEIHPGYTGGLIVLGRAHYEKKELDKAVEVLKKAVSETPESYLGQKFLGKALMDKGEVQDALRALEAAGLLSPDDTEVVHLIEEIRPKASPPKTMEFPDEEGTRRMEKDDIVTYEQKPTTVDGVELDPLPVEVDEEAFSFSDFQVEVEQVPTEVPIEKDEARGGEGATAEELGPEAAAFIEEAEELDEAFFSVPEEEDGQPGMPEIPVDVVEEIPAEPLDPDPSPGAAGSLQPGFVPHPPTEPAASGPEEPVVQDPHVSQVEAPRAADAAARPDNPPLDHSATGGVISTETLADLYAKQGLTDKAAEIYRKMLEEHPEDEGVRLKLQTLETMIRSEKPPASAEATPREPEPAMADGEAADPLATLQGWLENAERMKRS